MTAPESFQTTVDESIRLLYRAISGPAGVPRDWAALERLFLPGAPLLPLQRDPTSGTLHGTSWSLAEYRASRELFLETTGFHEEETRRECLVRGPLAQVLSWFTARREPNGDDLLRGVNAIQLVQTGDRWYVAALSWYREYDAIESAAHTTHGDCTSPVSRRRCRSS